jgi:RecB family endonuclease NucS
MQRIDIALSLQKNNDERLMIPIELKAVQASLLNVVQIQRYVDWLEQYYIPNRISTIQPVLIAKKFDNKDSKKYLQVIESFKQFNQKNKNCMPLRFIEFEVKEGKLKFSEINYNN